MRNIVFCAFGTDKLKQEAIELMCRYIPKSRIDASSRYRRECDRNNCIATYFLLRYGLFSECNITSIPDIYFNQYRKPYFANESDIFFNLSHCSGAVCAALSDSEIGADIQDRITDIGNILDLTMCENEKAALRDSCDPEALCTRFWSQKEAFLKYKATGLTNDINTYDFSSFTTTQFPFMEAYISSEFHCGCSVSACSERSYAQISVNDIEWYIQEYLKMIT